MMFYLYELKQLHVDIKTASTNNIVQSNLGTGRVATSGGRRTHIRRAQSFTRICQVAAVCTPTQHTIPWTHLTRHPKRQLKHFSSFCTV